MPLKSNQLSPADEGVIVRGPNRTPLHVIVWGAPNPREFTMSSYIAHDGLKGRFQLLVAFGTEFACYEAEARNDTRQTMPVSGTVHTDRQHQYENWHYDILRLDGFEAFVGQLQYSSSRSGVPWKALLRRLQQKNPPIDKIVIPLPTAAPEPPCHPSDGGPRLNTASNLARSTDDHVSNLLNRFSLLF